MVVATLLHQKFLQSMILLLYIPNSFTPNNDLKNESFKVSIMNHNTFEISIFDRFSELLYNSNDKNEGWDGNVQRKKQYRNGTYVVKIYATDLFGKVSKQTKTISFNTITL